MSMSLHQFLPFQKSHNIQNIFLFQINRNTIYKWLIIYLTNICDDMLTYRPCNKILRHLTMASQNFILYIWYVFLLIKVSYYAIQTQNFFFFYFCRSHRTVSIQIIICNSDSKKIFFAQP